MSIRSFEFEDRARGWRLNPVEFQRLNLLVGLSGVGKTSILNALMRVRNCGLGESHGLHDCRWDITLDTAAGPYRWRVTTEGAPSQGVHASLAPKGTGPETEPSPRLIHESLTLGDQTLIERTPNGFQFNGASLPKFKETESALSLLSGEALIAPASESLGNLYKSAASRLAESTVSWSYDDPEFSHESVEALRSDRQRNVLIKAYHLQKSFPEAFREIIEVFLDIFDVIEDVRFGPIEEFEPTFLQGMMKTSPNELISVGIKAAGGSGWIGARSISSGMVRTLIHLLEVALCPKDSVILIDEFENGLGVNCLPELTRFMVRRSTDLQLILTSHHPYVINNLPLESWRVVTRAGPDITVRPASSFPALTGASRQEAFIRLLNSEAFEDGMS